MSKAREDKSEVGYRKPPKAGQIKPGEVRNPKGRPKAARGVSAVDAVLDQKVALTINGKRSQVPAIQAVIAQTMDEALRGSRAARSDILRLEEKRLHGRAKKPGKAEPDVMPRGPPAIIFSTYSAGFFRKVGALVGERGEDLVPTTHLRVLLGLMPAEKRAEIGFSDVEHFVEDSEGVKATWPEWHLELGLQSIEPLVDSDQPGST